MAMVTTSPLQTYVDDKDNVAWEVTYLVVSLIPYAVTCFFLILALKLIHSFLVKFGKRFNLNICWIYVHALVFALFFATKIIWKIYFFFDVTKEVGLVE